MLIVYDNLSDFHQASKSIGGTTRLFGIDIGAKKFGIAYYNSNAPLTVPLGVFTIPERNKFHRLLDDMQITGIIAGLSFEETGLFDNAKKLKAEKQLEAILAGYQRELPIYFVDERYTTQIADTMLIEAGMNRKRRNKIDDAIAAKLILDNFLYLCSYNKIT